MLIRIIDKITSQFFQFQLWLYALKKMQNKNDFVFGIQAKSSTDLVRKMKIKVENDRALKSNPTNQEINNIQTNVGNIQKLDHRKQSKVEVSKKVVESNKSVVQNNNKKQLEVQATKKSVEPSKVSVQNSNIRRQFEVEVSNKVVETSKVPIQNIKRKLLVEASKKIVEPSKVLVNNNTKKKLKCTVDHQAKGSIESRVSKNIDEQTKEENQIQGSTVDQQAFDKKKTMRNKEQHGVEEFDDEDIEENEMEEYMENGSNYDGEEVGGKNVNKEEGNTLGASSSGLVRKRGKTLCRKIHAWEFKDRQEITLNEVGIPIGPDEKTVSELSSFLGTIGRNSNLCPLTFINWIALVKYWEEHEIDPVWEYVNEKYNVPKEGRKAVFAIEVSQQNAKNVAQLKWRHRMGNKGFAVIREKMRESNEDKEPPTQAEMFIATRQSRKGKELDQETNTAIIKLQDLIENQGKSSSEAFESVLGKQKPGRVRCHGRTTTPTLLKRNEEIAKLKRDHVAEVRHVIQEMEERRRQDKEETERRMQLLLKTILNQNTSNLDIEALAALISAPATDANSALRSSASTHAPTNDQNMNDDINGDFQSFGDEET
ncbi:uncharacterized protein LOC131597712 [Vicia villosa]|uniref:uncharacterized protein LOC131597712 n=1 Tax=Vicia villosa TaxID=3911 RepID=UPI00273B7086|nr:uncharacterized protein LOC131597712 [Vicia villosa]